MKITSITILEEKPGVISTPPSSLYLTGEIPRGENKLLISTDERQREKREERDR
jgi:hypothetical protein